MAWYWYVAVFLGAIFIFLAFIRLLLKWQDIELDDHNWPLKYVSASDEDRARDLKEFDRQINENRKTAQGLFVTFGILVIIGLLSVILLMLAVGKS